MIEKAIFPAFRTDGTKISLQLLLARIPDNDLKWSVLVFHGIGNAPSGQSMLEFERLAESTPEGFVMTWRELLDFAFHLDDTIECLVVAAKSVGDLMTIDRDSESLGLGELWLELNDSTEWLVQGQDSRLVSNISKVFEEV